MTLSFSTVGVIARTGNPLVLESVAVVLSCLAKLGANALLESATASALRQSSEIQIPSGQFATLDLARIEAIDRLELGTRCDLIVVVGGDGSLLGVGRDLAASGVPVIGVNRGGLGFLADIAPAQINASLSEVLAGKYFIEDHFLLAAQVQRQGDVIWQSAALNDVVVHPGRTARMMEFSLWVDDQFVYDQRSDGLIVASPTGSTAYSLSAGGPIMHPSLNAVVVVPMFPHTLTSRPLVVPGDSTLRIRVGALNESVPSVSCDSQVHVEFESGDEVVISKSPSPLKLLYSKDHSFYEACRSKLDWASRLGGQR